MGRRCCAVEAGDSCDAHRGDQGGVLSEILLVRPKRGSYTLISGEKPRSAPLAEASEPTVRPTSCTSGASQVAP